MTAVSIATIAEILDEARNGRMFILVDDEDRENEGDLIIPAQMATPSAINFMATYGRGLICLALDKARVDQLGLPLMSADNGTRHHTAFTVSIEACHGVTTGISAADRACTIAAAIDASRGPEHITTPGHVFPLVAKPGGVLVRAGHTEAAVDVARLAGLNPSGVICEIIRDDGEMARMPDLIAFATRHGLKIGTIRDLIAFRRKHDHDIVKAAQTQFTSKHGGSWRAVTYRNNAVGNETVALIKGQPNPAEPILVRMHSVSLFNDILGDDNEREGLLKRAMTLIGEAGEGIIVLINRLEPGPSSIAIHARRGTKPVDAKLAQEFRDYGIGAQILAEMGIEKMILLSNTTHTLVALAGYGLDIVETRAF